MAEELCGKNARARQKMTRSLFVLDRISNKMTATVEIITFVAEGEDLAFVSKQVHQLRPDDDIQVPEGWTLAGLTHHEPSVTCFLAKIVEKFALDTYLEDMFAKHASVPVTPTYIIAILVDHVFMSMDLLNNLTSWVTHPEVVLSHQLKICEVCTRHLGHQVRVPPSRDGWVEEQQKKHDDHMRIIHTVLPF